MTDKLNKLRTLRSALHSLHMTHAAYPRPLVAEYCAYNERRAEIAAMRPGVPRFADPYNDTRGLFTGLLQRMAVRA